MNRPPSLLIRADGGPGIGAGHLARCLALAQAWVDEGGWVTLVSHCPPAMWADRYLAEGAEVAEAAPGERFDWAVLDGYRFGSSDVEPLTAVADRLLVIDDHGTGSQARVYGADLALDQNLDATAEPYGDVEALLGTRYALLRREFRTGRDRRPRQTPDVARRLLVSLGAAPPAGARAAVTAAIDPDAFTVAVLDGVDDVPAAMAAAELAVSAAGSTCWELCRMGLPAVLLPIAPNQAPIAAAMERHGAAVAATPQTLAAALTVLANDPARRSAMAQRGLELVDGQGAVRVVDAMRSKGPIKEHA